MTDNKAKELMEQGWKAREELDFEKADKLLKEARVLFEKEKDWFNVTEAINHLAYSEKLKAVHHNLQGLHLAKGAEKIANDHSVRKHLVLRALMSLANSAGNFEAALKYGEEALKFYDKPLPRADILSHIATFQLRTGKMSKAEKTIEEAMKLCEEGFSLESEPHRSIWKSKILLTKGLILYNKGELDGAKELGQEALKLAESQDLKTRIEEIKKFLELFD